MALTIYGFRDYPHDFAVTKADARQEDCAFLLDFSRPLERIRWFGVTNSLVGPTVALRVPIIHRSEDTGSYSALVSRGEAYFSDLPKFWKEHAGHSRSIMEPVIDGLSVVADFGRHFPDGA